MSFIRFKKRVEIIFLGAFMFGPLGGVETPHSPKIADLAKHFSENTVQALDLGKELEMACFSSPQSDETIGFKFKIKIKAPIEKVAAAIEDFNSYPKMVPDLKVARVDEKKDNIWFTFWEQKVPVFFVPNVKFRMIYELTQVSAQKKIYRYQLEKKNAVTQSDGLIVIQENAGATDYLEYDFIDADWGIIRAFAGGKIWHESIKAITISDFAIRMRSENSEWPLDKVKDEAVALSESKPIEEKLQACLKSKVRIDMKSPLP